MIVEYFGIPGCGKTYQAVLYKQQLNSKGKRYIDISRYSGMPLWLKVFYKLADYTILILPKYRKQIAKYREVCKGALKEPAFVPLSLNNCINDIVLYSLIYDVFGRLGRIVVNDEGQLHRVIFLNVQFGVALDNLIPIYHSFRHREFCRYVKTTSEIAIQNIKRRNRRACIMDELKDETLRDYIKSFEGGCSKIESFHLEFVEIVINKIRA